MSDYQFNPEIEVWKPIPDYPGYEVSDHGQVRSFWKQGNDPKIISTPKMLSIHKMKGYHRVHLIKQGKGVIKRVNRLVLIAFVGPPPSRNQSCHKDDNKGNNFLDNLRWDTQTGNAKDVIKYGSVSGVHNGNAKLTDRDVLKIRCLHDMCGYSRFEIAKDFHFSASHIYRIVRRKSWKHLP